MVQKNPVKYNDARALIKKNTRPGREQQNGGERRWGEVSARLSTHIKGFSKQTIPDIVTVKTQKDSK